MGSCVSILACLFSLLWHSPVSQGDIHYHAFCIYNLLSLIQQEIENFKKLNLISKEEFDNLAPEPIADPAQEVPPGPPGLQKVK